VEVEEEEVDQQPSNRPPSHSEALQHVHSLMQFAQTNLPHLQHTLSLNLLTTTIVAPPSNASKWQMGFNSAFKGLINIFSEIERNWATANIQKKEQTTLYKFFTTPKRSKKVLFV
jgi:hypothetical protein